MITVLGTSAKDLTRAVPRVTGSAQARISDVVSPDDLIQAALCREPADRQRLLAGRAALRLLVAHWRGEPPQVASGLPIDRTCRRCGVRHGRPILPGLSLSTSGTRGTVLAGVAEEEEDRIGVDLEPVPDQIAPGFDGYVLHPAERERFSGQDRSDADDGDAAQRIALWVLKKAVLKAAGVGLDHPPDQLLLGSVQADSTWRSGDRDQVLSWCPVLRARDEVVDGLWVCLVPSPPGVLAALAARAPQEVHDAGPQLLGQACAA